MLNLIQLPLAIAFFSYFQLSVGINTQKYFKWNNENIFVCLITAKLTQDQNNAGDDIPQPEPETWWQKKKKAIDKFDRRARRACRKLMFQTFFFIQKGMKQLWYFFFG